MKDIPHLLYHGLTDYEPIINNMNLNNNYTLKIQCSFNNGIKNIREDILSFVKFQIPSYIKYKVVILFDAEFLTIESQYLLRRIIEIYSKNSRFILFTYNKDKLLKPIRSRFIHVYINGTPNIKININTTKIKKILNNNSNYNSITNQLYTNGIYSDILIKYLKGKINNYEHLYINYNNIKNIFKNEKMILLYLVIYYKNNINY